MRIGLYFKIKLINTNIFLTKFIFFIFLFEKLKTINLNI